MSHSLRPQRRKLVPFLPFPEPKMARSTDSPCFELESRTDLLAKAGNDLIDLKLNTHSHSLFNCVCTLNHMPDWISADPEAKHLAASGEELELRYGCRHQRQAR